jgi:hypothetical protein
MLQPNVRSAFARATPHTATPTLHSREAGTMDETESTQATRQGAASRAAGAAEGIVEGARRQAEATMTDAKRTAAGAAGDAAAAVDDVAGTLAQHGQETLSQAAASLSSRLQNIASYIETHSLDDVAREARRIAQNNPMLFIAGGVVVGLALGRLFKATAQAPRDEQSDQRGRSGNIDWTVDSAR